MNLERDFVSKIIEDEEVRTPIQEKIKTKFLYGNNESQAYKFIRDYYSEYGEVPSLETVKKYIPNFEMSEPDEPIEYYCDELRNRHKYNMLVESIEEVTEKMENGNIQQAVKEFQRKGSTIAIDTGKTNDLNFTEGVNERLERYERAKKADGVLGYEYPWNTLNEVIGGIMKQELITITAFQSVGKTWNLLYILHHLWQRGKKIALFTREMSPEQMQVRLDAIHFNLPYQDFKKGRLGERLEEYYYENVDEIRDAEDFIISGDEAEGTGLSTIRAKLEEYKPDVFAVDGLYLVKDERGATGWQAMVHLTQDTKRICRNLEIPGIVTTQAGVGSQSEGGVSLTDISFSKTSFGADSDVVLGLDDLDHMWRIKVLKSRESEGVSFKIKQDFERMRFEQVGEREAQDEDELEQELLEEDTIIYD